MRHINRNRLTAALAAASISLIAPAAAVLAGTAAASAGAPSAGVVARDVASSGSSGTDAPSDGATDDGSGDGTDSSNEVTDGNGDLCDPGVVPTDAPSASSTDSATSTDTTDTTDSTDSTDDGPGDTSCDDSHANLVGAVARAARAQVKAGRRARLAVDVTTARGTALATGKAVLFEHKTRVAVADVVAGKVTFSARGLSRGTHRLRVGLVSSTGTVVRAATVLRVTIR